MLALVPMPDRVRGRQAPPAPSKTEDAGEGDSARICVGIITGVHGIKGWVRVKSFTAAPEAIAAYGPLADDSGTRRIELELVGAGKGVLLARINGIDDRNAAERLKGLRLYVRRADLPPPDKDEFYQADLIGLSAERADGTRFGTVRAVSAGTLYESGKPQASWPEYKNGWTAPDTVLANADFKRLLLPVPTHTSDLQVLCNEFNQQYASTYTLAQLNPNGLNMGDGTPQIDNQTGSGASLLTTSTFVVGTTAGNYRAYTSIEMDDAIIGEACAASDTAFGFVRNISDPVQNAALPATVQGRWGSAVYDAYGFYTSYNGALAAWAMLA